MSENWKFMLSLKGNEPLLVTRGDTIEEFVENLHRLEENKEPISLVIASYAPQKPVLPKAPPATAPRPFVSPDASERELGPLVLENVEIKRSGKDGTVWKSPMFILKFDGTSASTFDQLVGKAAQGFWTQGAPCYVTVAPSPKNPRYSNVVSIRSAVAA